jgi:C1A family cysteine protease
MKTLLLSLLLSCNAFASTSSEIIISNLWKNIGHKSIPKKIENRIEEKVIKKEETPHKKPSPTPAPKLSAGQLKIEEMKRKNREKLKQKQEDQQTSAKNKSNSIYDIARDGLDDMKRKSRKTLSAWKEQEKETLRQWKKEREKFLSRVKQYKDNTFEMQSSATGSKNYTWDNTISSPASTEYHIVSSALDIEIRDQGKRPTCSAFAGTRALEIALAQKGIKKDLSEQYIYWASKPYCQTSPCSRKGSWISYAYEASENSLQRDIPSEDSCPYRSYSQPGNETQIPMKRSCTQGIVKVVSHKKINSTQGIFTALNNNLPVVAGLSLSPNFYKTKGIISYKDSLINGKMDEHANGHAVLIVGHMKVPSSYQNEGRSCFIVANSWSKGWATGGHGCITQKWLEKYKVPNPFLAITKIKE